MKHQFEKPTGICHTDSAFWRFAVIFNGAIGWRQNMEQLMKLSFHVLLISGQDSFPDQVSANYSL